MYASVIRWPEVATLAWWCWWPPGATLYLWCTEKYCLSWTRSALDFTEWSVQFHPLLAYYPLKLLVPHKSSLFFVAWLRGAASHHSEVAKARSTCHDVEYLGQPVISLTSWLLPSVGSLRFLFLGNPFPDSWTNTSIFHAENTLKGNSRTGTPQLKPWPCGSLWQVTLLKRCNQILHMPRSDSSLRTCQWDGRMVSLVRCFQHMPHPPFFLLVSSGCGFKPQNEWKSHVETMLTACRTYPPSLDADLLPATILNRS